MHISTYGVVRRSLYAAYWGNRFAAYEDGIGGMIIARLSDRHSLYFQPGDDAAVVRTALEAGCQDLDTDAAIDAIDRILAEYDVVDWLSPDAAGAAPSSDGGLFNVYN